MAENERLDDVDERGRAGRPGADVGDDADVPTDPLLDWDQGEGEPPAGQSDEPPAA